MNAQGCCYGRFSVISQRQSGDNRREVEARRVIIAL